LEYDLKLISEKFIVDGKSIMGIFCLDLSKPIIVDILQGENIYPRELEEFMVKVA
jgi:hypothetical protein